ncbi:MAG: betaine-aldehyde dehydrogenase [Rhodobacteraceae bacterium]|nr:betaine-aldehyde dehydrogenase [Paracoccaceae bacterium]
MTLQPPASHFVAGAFREDAAGEAIPVIYPATGEEIARVHAATPAILEEALAAAAAAQPAWAALRPVERGRVLTRAAWLIRERAEELARLETLDTGKPISETRVADWPSCADALEFFGGLAATISGEMIPLGGDWAYTMRVPLGVTVGIGAWNYPTQTAAWKAAPALACGNTMVFKPSELTPLGALRLAGILAEAGAPPGVFSVVQGRGDVGAALAGDARVRKVALTGSVPTGRKVYRLAAEGMRRATLELGGKSPLVIFADADLDAAVGGAMLGNFYSSGQVCSNGTRVFVERSVETEFLARLAARTAAIRIGDPLDESTTFGPLISEAQREKVLGYIAAGRAEGARLVIGGGVPQRPGFYVEPTVFADVTDDMTIAREEIFGPVMCVLAFDTEEEVIARANATEFGLSAGVFTRDLARAHRVIGRIAAGSCWINSYNLTPVEVPFGGTKMSGLGHENGRSAIEHWTEVKTVYVGQGGVDAPW